ncbi:MAG: hypothetical protein HY876_00310 [Coriobacteriales bacterium]|nr:hypothetical protein [Coriobacteriales bacterium]
MKAILHKVAALALLASIATAVLALPAIAASKHSIAGTCRNDAQWYVSTTDRTVASNNTSIQASFHDLCVKPMQFKLINAKTGGQLGRTITASGDVQTLATAVKAGTVFNNAFRLTSSCYSWQDRNFAGSEWY